MKSLTDVFFSLFQCDKHQERAQQTFATCTTDGNSPTVLTICYETHWREQTLLLEITKKEKTQH